MKKRILLVDGYNMIAFWQETRQLFKTNQLDQARETLLRKLNHLNILILSVYLMLSLFQGAVSVMISIVSVLFLLRKMRQQLAILSAQRLR